MNWIPMAERIGIFYKKIGEGKWENALLHKYTNSDYLTHRQALS